MVVEGGEVDRIEELKTLAKARTATEFDERSPAWLGLDAEEATDPAAALADAIDSMADPVFRAAAAALFPLPYDTSPGSLSERRHEAARHFNVGASTFRTSSPSRPSYEEQVLGAVLSQLETERPEAPHRPAVAAASTKRIWLVALALALALVAGALGLITLGRDDPPTPEAGTTTDRPELPDAPTLPPGPEAAQTFTPSRTEDPLAGSADVEPCPTVNVDLAQDRVSGVTAAMQRIGRSGRLCQATSPTDHWDMTTVLFREFGRRESWVHVLYPDGHQLVIPTLAWERYQSLRDHQGGDQRTGRPASWTLHPDGSSELETDGGDVIIGVAAALPHFYLTGPFLDPWRVHRDEIGAPMSDASSLQVDFEHGEIELIEGAAEVTVVSPEQAQRALPPPSRLHNSIVRQSNGTAWFVDADERRWWIPDESVFICLDGAGHASLDPAPGPTVATLPPAGLATCKFASLY